MRSRQAASASSDVRGRRAAGGRCREPSRPRGRGGRRSGRSRPGRGAASRGASSGGPPPATPEARPISAMRLQKSAATGNLSARGAAGRDGRRADRRDRPREARREPDPARGHLEVGRERLRLGEAAVRREVEGDELEAVRREGGGEAGRSCGIVADHGVGDLDPGVAARRDRREEVVRPAAPGRRPSISQV